MTIHEGDLAPAFNLPATKSRFVSDAALLGRPYVLYFYPKADTSGCTKEAVAFQQSLPKSSALGLEIIGVSRDPLRALEKFAAKYNLEFPLASDEAGTLSDAYGVWIEKSMYGRKYMGMERSTFLIGPDRKVIRAWHKVKVEGHANEVLKSVEEARMGEMSHPPQTPRRL